MIFAHAQCPFHKRVWKFAVVSNILDFAASRPMETSFQLDSWNISFTGLFLFSTRLTFYSSNCLHVWSKPLWPHQTLCSNNSFMLQDWFAEPWTNFSALKLNSGCYERMKTKDTVYFSSSSSSSTLVAAVLSRESTPRIQWDRDAARCYRSCHSAPTVTCHPCLLLYYAHFSSCSTET